MSEIIYIDTDDEIYYTEEDIRELCQEDKDLLDIDKLILTREKKNRRKIYEENVYKDIITDIEIGKKIIEKYNLAIKENTPVEMIYKDEKNNFFSIREKLKNNENTLEVLKYFRNEYNINIDEFILAYYFSNIYMSEKYIIEGLNRIKKITNIEYNINEWPEKKKRFNVVFNERMELTKKKFKKIKTFYGLINDIPFSTEPDKINETFELKDTKINAKIKQENYFFDIDSGAIIFDELRVDKDFPYIQYNSYDEKYYKIYDKSLDLINIIKARDNIFNNLEEDECETINRIYIINKLELFNKTYHILLEINLENSTLTFKYPSNSSYKIISYLKKLIPGLIIKEEKILSVNGTFEIKLDNYQELNFYYLTLFDEKFSKFFYLKEDKRPRSLMKNIKYYYKNYKDNYLESNFSVSFYLEKLYINKYAVNFKSKIEEKDNNINEFALVLSKLIYYYEKYDFKNTDLPIITNPYTGKDGDGLGDNLKDEDLNFNKNIQKGKKLLNLINEAPEIFPVSSYGRKCLCPNQPIKIEEEDLTDWQRYLDKNSVSIFPPENSIDKGKRKYIFVCPTDNLVFNYIVNPDIKSPFPILPCCGQTANNDYYQYYNEIKKDPENFFTIKEGKKSTITKNILKKVAPLASGQKGNLPLTLKQFLKRIYPNLEFYRYGLNKNSKSSLFHCCMYASNHLNILSKKIKNKKYLRNIKFLEEIKSKYNGLDISDKDLLVDKIKSRISNNQSIKINMEIVYQELYNFDNNTINFLLENEPLDSKYFYKLMEYLFFLNIFVFIFKNGNLKLEKPNHQYYHQREYRYDLPCLLLIKHEDGPYPIYEIIENEKNKLLGKNFLEHMENYINKYGYYISYFIEDKYTITKNFYSNINWNIILKDYLIIEQFINDSGRVFALNVNYSKDNEDIITIFIPSSYPLDVPKANKVYKVEKKICIKLFGKNFIIGSEGFWYGLNNIEKAIFIPIKEIKEKNKYICYPYITIEKRCKGINNFKKINTIKKNSKIIMQIIIWVWSISKETDLDKWFDYYIAKGDKKTINTICNNKLIIDYRFPPDIKTPEEAIEYYSDYIPSMFGKDVIFLYEELENVIYQHLKNYNTSTNGYGKIINKAIVDIFNNDSDFTERLSNRLIIGEENFDDWYNFLETENKDYLVLDNNLMTMHRGFLYKNNNGNIFIIQNNIENSLKISILTAKVWRRLKYNLGYNVTSVNIWNSIKEDHNLLEVLDLNNEKIIKLASNYNRYSDIKLDDLYSALDYLFREKIELELEESDYDYITLNYMEYINKENLKTSDPYNLFSYENEAYAAMLNLG